MKLFTIRWRDDATGRFLPAEFARKLSRALVSRVKLRRRPKQANWIHEGSMHRGGIIPPQTHRDRPPPPAPSKNAKP